MAGRYVAYCLAVLLQSASCLGISAGHVEGHIHLHRHHSHRTHIPEEPVQWEPVQQAACSADTLMQSQLENIHLHNCSKEAPCNAVIAAALSYDPGTYQVFLDSYRAHCSGNKDNIFLLVTGTDVHKHSEKMCKAVQEQGVTYVVLEEDTSHNTPIVQRHIAYLKLLELQGDLLSNILFSDSRDVVFQGCPFPQQDQPWDAVHFSLEAQNGLAPNISQEHTGWNAKWLSCFGDAVLTAASHNPVSCVGELHGGTRHLQEFLKLAYKVVTDELIMKPVCFTEYGGAGADQGMLNYILWYLSKERPDLIHFKIVVEPNNGTVYTVGMLQGEHANYIQKPDGLYTPTDAKLPVVHQYDRLPGAVVQFQHMYPCSWSC